MTVSSTTVVSSPVSPPGGSVGWRLMVAALLLASAALQIQASLQRWVGAWHASEYRGIAIDDEAFDYTIPFDGWEPLGTAAQVHGVGVIIQALGVLALARAVRQLHGVGVLLTLAVAVPFALFGINAVVAGLTGAPFVIHSLVLPLYLVNLVGFIGIAISWRRSTHSSVADMLAGACLLGSSMPGVLLATLVVAPLIHGRISHDTSRWTETVVGATTATAGLMALVAAGVALWRHRRRRRTGSATTP